MGGDLKCPKGEWFAETGTRRGRDELVNDIQRKDRD